MFCPNCGTKNEDNAKFCFKCGTSLEVSNEAEKMSCDEMKSQMMAKGFVLLEESDTTQKWKNFDTEETVEIEKIDSEWCQEKIQESTVQEEIIPTTQNQNSNRSKTNKIIGSAVGILTIITIGWIFGREKLGTMKYNEGIQADKVQDYTKALDLYADACDYGNALGCTNLGYMYEKGNSVAQDHACAIKLFKQGCEGGVAVGCSNLGTMYNNGIGVIQDHKKATDFFKRACDNGDTLGCTKLALQYQNGEGIEKDYVKAFNLYNKACNNGDISACGSLGMMYEDGIGVAKNIEEALKLYKQSCDGGENIICGSLGDLYQYGEGVPIDHVKALNFYKQSCDGGSDIGCSNYKELNAKINQPNEVQ